MSFTHGTTYRFRNKYYSGYALNVYGTNAASTGRNVCLYTNDTSDVMQNWVLKDSEYGYRLHSAVNNNFVLDCSDGSLSNSYANNAHLCAISQTNPDDCVVEFEKVSDNVYKIYLPGHDRYLTATNTELVNGLPASSISNATALIGGTGGKSNVYWAIESASLKQQWIVSPEVDGDDEDEPTGNMTLAQLKQKFPNGKYWNHVGMEGNNADSYTSSPCPSHATTATCNCFDVNPADPSYQCLGFAEKCGYDFSGSNPRTSWTKVESESALNTLKPGDIVRYYLTTAREDDKQHAIFVTGVSGNTITFGDCNANGNCKIRWGATTTKQNFTSKLHFVRVAPFALS